MRIRRQVDLNLEAEFNIRVSQRVIKANAGPIVVSGCYRRRSSEGFSSLGMMISRELLDCP